MNFFKGLEKSNDNSYFFSKEKQYSYDQIFEDSKIFNEIHENRTLVFLVANNSYEFLTAYVGLLRSNNVVALINDSISEASFNNLLTKFKPGFIYKTPSKFAHKKKWKEKFHFGEYVLYETNIEIDYKLNNNLCMLLMTSGSTGSPEFVRLSYSNIISNTKAICEYLNINKSDKAITTLPASYSYGISIINTHLSVGASLVLTDSAVVEKRFWNLLDKHKITTFSGVPYTYKVLKKLNFKNIDLPHIKYITQAGGKLSLELIDYFRKSCAEKSIKFFIMYGQTEASPRMSYLPPIMLEAKPDSIGIPIPGGEFFVVYGKDNIINSHGVEGELVFKGKNVCLGYAKDCYDLSSGDSNRGKLVTGDMGKVDSDGYYYITGRKK